MQYRSARFSGLGSAADTAESLACRAPGGGSIWRRTVCPVYANRRRIRGRRGRRSQRRRSELVARPFAHQFGTGGLRRILVRGHHNVRTRLLIHVCGFNLGLLMRHLTGAGTPRSLQSRAPALQLTHFSAKTGHWIGSGSASGRGFGSIRCFRLLGPINKPSPLSDCGKNDSRRNQNCCQGLTTFIY